MLFTRSKSISAVFQSNKAFVLVREGIQPIGNFIAKSPGWTPESVQVNGNEVVVTYENGGVKTFTLHGQQTSCSL